MGGGGFRKLLTFVQVGKTYKTLLCCQSQQKHGKVKGNNVSTWNMGRQKKILAWYKIPVIYMAWWVMCIISGFCTHKHCLKGSQTIWTVITKLIITCQSSLNSKPKTKIQKHVELTTYKISAVLHLDSQRQCYKRVFKSPWNAPCNAI